MCECQGAVASSRAAYILLREKAMEPLFFILALFILVVVIRLAAGSMDRDRVDEYLRQRGGKLISAEWEMFGSGWSGDKNRIYRVRYLDADGEERTAICKTKALSAVYFTQDEPVLPVPSAQHSEAPPLPDNSSFLIHGL